MKLEVRYWKQGSCSRGDVDILTEGPETADDVRSGLRSSEAVEEGRVKKGDRIMLLSFGGGLTWASMLVEW